MEDVSILQGKQGSRWIEVYVNRGSKSGWILTTKPQWRFTSWFMEVISDNYDELISLGFYSIRATEGETTILVLNIIANHSDCSLHKSWHLLGIQCEAMKSAEGL